MIWSLIASRHSDISFLAVFEDFVDVSPLGIFLLDILVFILSLRSFLSFFVTALSAEQPFIFFFLYRHLHIEVLFTLNICLSENCISDSVSLVFGKSFAASDGFVGLLFFFVEILEHFADILFQLGILVGPQVYLVLLLILPHTFLHLAFFNHNFEPIMLIFEFNSLQEL